MRFRLIVVVLVAALGIGGRVRRKKQPPRVVEPIAVGYRLDDDRFAYDGSTRHTHRGFLKEFVQGNGKIAYLDRGSLTGEVIVLLHGTPTSSWLYRNIIPGLLERGYRVIAPDMPGYGASVYTQFADPSVQQYTTTLALLLEHLDIEQYALAGHDIGSLRMRNLALRSSQNVTYLIVFNSLVTTESFHPPFGFNTPTLSTKLITRALQYDRIATMVMKQILRGGGLHASALGEEGVEGYSTPFVLGAYGSYMHTISHLSELRNVLDAMTPQLSKLASIRTLVIRGTEDSVLRADLALPVLEKNVGLSSRDEHLFDDAGHFVMEQKPEEIVELMDTFMKTYYDEERIKRGAEPKILPPMEINPTEEL